MRSDPAPFRSRGARGGSACAGAFLLRNAALAVTLAACSASGEAPSGPGQAAEPPDGPYATQQELREDARMSLLVLRARAVEDSLAGYSAVRVPERYHTIGDSIPVRFEILNGLGAPLELPAPPEGLRVELQWEVERWLAYSARERQSNFRVARLEGGVTLAAGEIFREETLLPLKMEADMSALWSVEIRARLRTNGAELDGQALPVKEVVFKPARFLALPSGWHLLRRDPLAQLRRAVALPSRDVDRHVVVCAALLPERDREAGLEVLMQALNDPVDEERALAVATALTWLTREDLGLTVEAWNLWWERRKMEGRP